MILLDSSGWIEIFAGGKLSKKFEQHLKGNWIVSAINVFEVYKKMASVSEDKALQAVSFMKQGQEIPVDSEISLEAADLSHKHKLGMADSLILATAIRKKATLVTKDSDFCQIPGCVVYL